MESSGKTRTKRTRVNFTIPQIEVLETIFSQTQYPDVTVVEALAKRLDLPVEKICTWFQNRRSKFRRESKSGHIEMMRKQMFQDDKVASTSFLKKSHKSVIKSVNESDKKKNCVRQESTKQQSPRYNSYGANSQSTRYSPYSKPSSSQSTPCNMRWTNEQQYWQQTTAYQPSYTTSGSNHVNQGGYSSTSHLPYSLTPQQMASLYYNPALPGYPGIPTQSTGFPTMSPTASSSHDPDYTTTSTGKYPVYTSRLPDLPGCTTVMKTSPTGGATSAVSGASSHNGSCSESPSGQDGQSRSSCAQYGLSGSPSAQYELSGSPSSQYGLSGSSSTHVPSSGLPSSPVQLSPLDYSSTCLYSDPAFTFMYSS